MVMLAIMVMVMGLIVMVDGDVGDHGDGDGIDSDG